VGFEQLYLSHSALIDHAIDVICRRQRLPAADAEDFAGAVRLHLIEDDYAVLRRFQGRSSLRTYLLIVVTHQYQDWRNARWGKWRPSAEARRLGPIGVHLERLVVRDGLTFEEAHETLRTNFRVPESRQSLEAMAARFPLRWGRHFVSDEAIHDRPAADTLADAPLREREATAAARAAVAALAAVVTALPPQDRLIVKMRFQDDFSIADIARTLHLDQKHLYRRVERLLGDLRAGLKGMGVTAAAAAEILEQGGFDLVSEYQGAGRGTGDAPRPADPGDASLQSQRTP
jgi:RNA polymerase sigma factor (sigma-70 family)